MLDSKPLLLVVDDDEDVLLTAKMILRTQYTVKTLSSPKQLETQLNSQQVECVLLDMNFKAGATTGNEGLYWLRQIKKHSPQTAVVMNTAYGDIQLAVSCMKEGATDFLVKPWEKEKLLTTIDNVVKLNRSQQKITTLKSAEKALNADIKQSTGELIGESSAMQEVYKTIRKVAATAANVLILGENGTGKELVARAIHQNSPRNSERFVKVDLGALSASLYESELFGHVKGAFTDAKEDQVGRFEMAHKGTLFLDEIGNISLEQQVKLLTVLQNRQVYRVGSSKAIDIDIRLVAATNQPIENMVERLDFREDLLYRINTITITLPALRDREGDVELLSRHFLKMYGNKYHKSEIRISDEAISHLNNYSWPGNVRELQHAIERAVIMCDSNALTKEDFPMPSKRKTQDKPASLKVEDIEKEAIEQAIEKHNGNLTKAADTLGMGRSTLYRKLDKYGLS
ncbi:sigma-54-dependent Fis family transcriptional regulator [Fulvivirga sp. RKSG066]|uniref:sigma-54-dependent transcriptional regulator n=1 Tax=Fulvivirga aurantia TaxID=2529383 RepID=UPI0012BB8359|nr:sigma-54 dependent transcriptional regulator [Fulvivirga aurantia]MTI21422.1 sigma-54-dependent Fis family transcriptional regulator [Fulvivirga aurantia]